MTANTYYHSDQRRSQPILSETNSDNNVAEDIFPVPQRSRNLRPMRSFTQICPLHCNHNVVHYGLFYTGYLMVLMLFFFTISVLIHTSPLLGDANELIQDSHTTIKDLQVIIPDVKNALRILDDFCKMNEFAKYCT